MEAVKEQVSTQARAIDIESMQRSQKLNLADEDICLEVKDFNLFYGSKQALHNINMSVAKNRVTAFIGPSGCGKSTLLRCFNRMNDLIDTVKINGQMLLMAKILINSQLMLLTYVDKLAWCSKSQIHFQNQFMKMSLMASDYKV